METTRRLTPYTAILLFPCTNYTWPNWGRNKLPNCFSPLIYFVCCNVEINVELNWIEYANWKYAGYFIRFFHVVVLYYSGESTRLDDVNVAVGGTKYRYYHEKTRCSHQMEYHCGVSWPSGLAYWTQVLVLAAECGFESRPWHLCPWARHLIIIASLHPGVKWVPVRAELVD